MSVDGASSVWLSEDRTRLAVLADHEDGVSRLHVYGGDGDKVATSRSELDIRTAAWLSGDAGLVAVATTPGQEAPRRTRLVELLVDGDELRAGREWDLPGGQEAVGEVFVPADGKEIYLAVQPRSLVTEESSVIALELATGKHRTVVSSESGFSATDPCLLATGDVLFERGSLDGDGSGQDEQGLLIAGGDDVRRWAGNMWTLTPECSADGSVVVFAQYGREDGSRHPPVMRTAPDSGAPVQSLGPAPVRWSLSSDGALLAFVDRQGQVRVEDPPSLERGSE